MAVNSEKRLHNYIYPDFLFPPTAGLAAPEVFMTENRGDSLALWKKSFKLFVLS